MVKKIGLLIVFLSLKIVADTNKGYTLVEIAKHSQSNDCWMGIDDYVYDVSDYSGEHKSKHKFNYGKFCGKDASAAWATKDEKKKPHKTRSKILLQKYLIGKII
jgi:cytochrome b involved in lipid metabolism